MDCSCAASAASLASPDATSRRSTRDENRGLAVEKVTNGSAFDPPLQSERRRALRHALLEGRRQLLLHRVHVRAVRASLEMRTHLTLGRHRESPSVTPKRAIRSIQTLSGPDGTAPVVKRSGE